MVRMFLGDTTQYRREYDRYAVFFGESVFSWADFSVYLLILPNKATHFGRKVAGEVFGDPEYFGLQSGDN